MSTEFLMGNAAVALGALHAGVNVVCGYPGTPSTEVLETIAERVNSNYDAGQISSNTAPHVEWSVNEKAALEVAAGASMAGARALVTMKQVGLNVASDPLMSLSYLGAKGGLVLYVADDPGPISSQTEQDTRQFAQFAKIPVLDAATPQELYSLMPVAFELSEKFMTPVIVRATTRICHGSAVIDLAQDYDSYTAHPISGFKRDPHWVSFPSLVTKAHKEITDRSYAIANLFNNFKANKLLELSLGHDSPATIGVAASGISWSYLLDGLEDIDQEHLAQLRLFKIVTPFPFVDDLAIEFLDGLDAVIVFEELEAVIERELLRVAGANQINVAIFGKLTEHTAIAGENSVALIAKQLIDFMRQVELYKAGYEAEDEAEHEAGDDSLSEPLSETTELTKLTEPTEPTEQPPESPGRPPVLCAGCPHRASFAAVKRALKGQKATYSGDIGCYTLGNALPLDMVDSCVCMGAGFTVPQGMHWAEPDVKHIGFLGDSTFFASGMTGVANAVYNQTPVTFFILDNSITAMTGSQPHPGTGIRMSYDSTPSDIANAISIPDVLRALGVDHVVEQNPFDFDNAKTVVRQAIELNGVSAVVFKAPCINVSKPQAIPEVDIQKCTACRRCVEILGCPALTMVKAEPKVKSKRENHIQIDDSLCYGCDLCVQVCPFKAIVSNHEGDKHAN
jgi:indolepyruvate ferredoxin oxidoreductase alpha subunit